MAKKKNSGRKSSDLDYRKRIDDVIDQICSGVTGRSQLLFFIVDKYGVSESQAEKDYYNARDEIREMKHEDLANEIEDAILRYKYLIKKNKEEGDYREARNCQTDLNKLLGLDAPKRVEVNVKAGLDTEDQYE